MLILEGTGDKVPEEFIMYKLAEKFGWTEDQILNTSYNFIASILKIMRIENDYIEWKAKKDGNSR